MSSKESLPIDNEEKRRIMREHPFLPIFLEAANPLSKYKEICMETTTKLAEIHNTILFINEEKSLPEVLANFVSEGYKEKVFIPPEGKSPITFNFILASQIQFAYFLGGDIGNEGIELFSEQIVEAIEQVGILSLDDQEQIPQKTHKFFKRVMKKGADFYSQRPYLGEMFANRIHVTGDISQLGQPENPNSGKDIIEEFLRNKVGIDEPNMN